MKALTEPMMVVLILFASINIEVTAQHLPPELQDRFSISMQWYAPPMAMIMARTCLDSTMKNTRTQGIDYF